MEMSKVFNNEKLAKDLKNYAKFINLVVDFNRDEIIILTPDGYEITSEMDAGLPKEGDNIDFWFGWKDRRREWDVNIFNEDSTLKATLYPVRNHKTLVQVFETITNPIAVNPE